MIKVALLGAGAVGAYFIWGLSEKLGDNFCVVAKGTRKEKLETEGIIINDRRYIPIVKEPEELKQTDLLIVACKYEALPEAMDDIRTIVKAHTTVISFMNGVTSEEMIGQAVVYDSLAHNSSLFLAVERGRVVLIIDNNGVCVFRSIDALCLSLIELCALFHLFDSFLCDLCF